MDFINFPYIIMYTIGTLCGLIFGARWGVLKGMTIGIKGTIAELEYQEMLPKDWRKQLESKELKLTPQAVERLLHDIENSKEDEK